MKELFEQKAVLIAYLKLKTDQQDWHAVADAANDLRELEVLLKFAESAENRIRERR
jgi:hypothetical protein